ncbi:MAG: hypothetical protein WCB62_28600 [Pseudolabrys sp.]
MKTVLAVALSIVLLDPSLAAACSGHKHRKLATCSSTTSLTARTTTVCRRS